MKKLIAALAVLAIAAAAQADLLASWNFTGSTGSAWGAVQGGVDGTTGENVASAKLTAVNISGYGTGNNQLRPTQAGWGEAAVAADKASYLDVKLTAASGYTLTVNEIQMNVGGSGTGINGTAAWSDGSQLISSSWTTANNASFKPTLTSNPSGSTVELRLIATLTGGNWGFNSVASDAANKSLIINGKATEATSVPEPATMSLLGLGALAMVLRRKLRK